MSHTVYISDLTGNRTTVIDSFKKLEYARVENQAAPCYLTVPAKNYDVSLFMENFTIEIERSLEGGQPTLQLETAYFIKKIESLIQNNSLYYLITAYDANILLSDRIVAYPANSPYSNKLNMALDDMMKAIITENFGASAVAARRISGLTVQGNTASAPVITEKSFAWKQVFTTLQELANLSYQRGTYLVFDLIKTGEAAYQFRTYVGQRGTDRTSTSKNSILIGDQYGNFSDPKYVLDYSNKATMAYVGGQGEDELRMISEVTGTISGNYDRKEIFVDARNSDSLSELNEEGRQALIENKTITTLAGRLIETPGFQYGIDYFWGDMVTATSNDITIPKAHISSVRIIEENGIESSEAYLRGEL